MKVTVIGCGYVGLVTGACLSKLGHSVTIHDKDERKLDVLEKGECPIFEPGLEEILRDYPVKTERSLVESVFDADVVFLAVGTPQGADGQSDMSAMYEVARALSKIDHLSAAIVIKSTVPVGTAEIVEEMIGNTHAAVVSNPEFLREGSAVGDFLNPDKIVIGSCTPWAVNTVYTLYALAGFSDRQIITLEDNRTAEFCKYVSNVMLACKIGLVNELAVAADHLHADIDRALDIVARDPRIGGDFMRPGPGWGGSCFGKDVSSLQYQTRDTTLALLREITSSNIIVTEHWLDVIDASTNKAAVLGIAFKANTDDTRDSPAERIIESLLRIGINVSVYDPQAVTQHRKARQHVDMYEALEGVEVIVIATEWPEFRSIDWHKVRTLAPKALIVDTRGMVDSKSVRSLGFGYRRLGKS